MPRLRKWARKKYSRRLLKKNLRDRHQSHAAFAISEMQCCSQYFVWPLPLSKDSIFWLRLPNFSKISRIQPFLSALLFLFVMRLYNKKCHKEYYVYHAYILNKFVLYFSSLFFYDSFHLQLGKKLSSSERMIFKKKKNWTDNQNDKKQCLTWASVGVRCLFCLHWRWPSCHEWHSDHTTLDLWPGHALRCRLWRFPCCPNVTLCEQKSATKYVSKVSGHPLRTIISAEKEKGWGYRESNFIWKLLMKQ